MDPQKAIHIKEEETDCAPDERGLMSYGTRAMDHQQPTYIKEEETYCAPDEPGLMFPVDPLQPEVPGLPIKPDPELKLHIATSENNSYGTLAVDYQQTTYIKEEDTDCAPDEPGLMCVEYPLDISWPTDFMKEEPALNLEAEDTVNILVDLSAVGSRSSFVSEEEAMVVASRNYASNSTRLLQNESCHISIEETVNQGLVHSELELHSKKSIRFPMFGEEEEEEGGDQGDSVMERSEQQCSSMEDLKSLETSFKDTSNTIINDHADVHGKDVTSYTTVSINAHNGLLPLKRPHKCDVCGKSFGKLSHLKRHAFIHSGIKPYKCDICDKYFSRLGTLKNHILMHKGTAHTNVIIVASLIVCWVI